MYWQICFYLLSFWKLHRLFSKWWILIPLLLELRTGLHQSSFDWKWLLPESGRPDERVAQMFCPDFIWEKLYFYRLIFCLIQNNASAFLVWWNSKRASLIFSDLPAEPTTSTFIQSSSDSDDIKHGLDFFNRSMEIASDTNLSDFKEEIVVLTWIGTCHEICVTR